MRYYRYQVWHQGSCLIESEYNYEILDEAIEEAEQAALWKIEDWKKEGAYDEEYDPKGPDDFELMIYAVEDELYGDGSEYVRCVWEN